MQKRKRSTEVLSWIMAIAMILTLFPPVAFATVEEDNPPPAPQDIEVSFTPADYVAMGTWFAPAAGNTAIHDVEWVTDFGRTDNYSLRIDRSETAGNFGNAANAIRMNIGGDMANTLSPGFGYEITAWFYVPAAENAGRTTGRGGAETVIHPQIGPNNAAGTMPTWRPAQGHINNYLWIPIGEWVAFTIQSPLPTVTGALGFVDFAFGGGAANMPHVWYMDDISIRRVYYADTPEACTVFPVTAPIHLWETGRPNIEVLSTLPSLHELYADYFYLGAIINSGEVGPTAANRDEFIAMYTHKYNVLTVQNDMKPSHVWPGGAGTTPAFNPDSANNARIRQMLEWAAEAEMRVHGHTLIWYTGQSPAWINQAAGNELHDYLTAQENMRLFIDTIIEEWMYHRLEDGSPVVASLDVLNEAFWYNTDGVTGESGYVHGGGVPFGIPGDPRLNSPTGDWRDGEWRYGLRGPTTAGWGGAGGVGWGGSSNGRWWQNYNTPSYVDGVGYVSPDCPSDYIYDAFVFTRLALRRLDLDEVLLYYNDFNEEMAPKRYNIALMVEELNNRWMLDERNTMPGRPLIDVIGMQGHYWTAWFDVEADLRTSMEIFVETFERNAAEFDRLQAAGLIPASVENEFIPLLAITEIDIPQGAYYNQYNHSPLSAEQELTQAILYAELFSLLKEFSDYMVAASFWGHSDSFSWRSFGQPLLFDNFQQPKMAFWAVVDPEAFLAEHETASAALKSTVTFVLGAGATGIEERTVRYGQAIDRLHLRYDWTPPAREDGQVLLGWSMKADEMYPGSGPGTIVRGTPRAPFALSDFHWHLTEDLTLYAVWGEGVDITFTVGDEVETVTVAPGNWIGDANTPSNPIPPRGYAFVGWQQVDTDGDPLPDVPVRSRAQVLVLPAAEGMAFVAVFEYVGEELDFTALEALIAYAEDLTETDFTPETWADLEDALADARYALDNATTQDEIDQAYDDLQDAIDALVARGTPVTPPTITPATLPNGTVGTAYTATLTATGDVPITWAVTTGALPAGLTLDPATGAITGTPTTAGTFTFAVTATNAGGSATQEFTIVVAPPTDEPNRDALRDALAEADELDEASYSARSWAAVADARDVAQAVLDDPASTQEEIDAATDALLEAIAELEEFHAAYMFGNDRGEFRPGGAITRAEVAAILARVMIDDFDSSVDHADYELPASMDSFTVFPDVTANNWFYHYVAWVSYEGLVLGDDQGNFRPNAPISRQELAMMIARIDGIAETAGSMSFGDAADIAGWARAAVYTVYSQDLMQGDDQGNFRPRANITRAEVATVINRMLGRLDSRDTYDAVDVERDNARVFPDVNAGAEPMRWYFPSVLAAANDHYLTRNDGNIDWMYVRVQPTS